MLDVLLSLQRRTIQGLDHKQEEKMRQEEHSRKRTRHKLNGGDQQEEQKKRKEKEKKIRVTTKNEAHCVCVREDGRMRKDTMMQIFVKTYGSTAIVSFQRRSSAIGGEGPRHNGVT